MKKVNFKNVLVALAVVTTFLLAGVETVGAQTIASAPGSPAPLTKAVFAVPTGNFSGVDQSLVLLQTEMANLKTQMLALSPQGPGTQPFDGLHLKFSYYRLIETALSSGQASVPTAISQALVRLSGANPSLGQNELLTLKQGAIDLLN